MPSGLLKSVGAAASAMFSSSKKEKEEEKKKEDAVDEKEKEGEDGSDSDEGGDDENVQAPWTNGAASDNEEKEEESKKKKSSKKKTTKKKKKAKADEDGGDDKPKKEKTKKTTTTAAKKEAKPAFDPTTLRVKSELPASGGKKLTIKIAPLIEAKRFIKLPDAVADEKKKPVRTRNLKNRVTALFDNQLNAKPTLQDDAIASLWIGQFDDGKYASVFFDVMGTMMQLTASDAVSLVGRSPLLDKRHATVCKEIDELDKIFTEDVTSPADKKTKKDATDRLTKLMTSLMPEYLVPADDKINHNGIVAWFLPPEVVEHAIKGVAFQRLKRQHAGEPNVYDLMDSSKRATAPLKQLLSDPSTHGKVLKGAEATVLERQKKMAELAGADFVDRMFPILKRDKKLPEIDTALLNGSGTANAAKLSDAVFRAYHTGPDFVAMKDGDCLWATKWPGPEQLAKAVGVDELGLFKALVHVHPDWLVAAERRHLKKAETKPMEVEKPKTKKSEDAEMKDAPAPPAKKKEEEKKKEEMAPPAKQEKKKKEEEAPPKSPAKKRKAEETAVKPAVAATNGKAHKTEEKKDAPKSQFNAVKKQEAAAAPPPRSPVKAVAPAPKEEEEEESEEEEEEEEKKVEPSPFD
jgi:hypothetical protein